MTLDPLASLPSIKEPPKIDSSKVANTEDALLKEQTDKFESIMLKIMLDNSMKTQNYLFPKEAGHEIYESMYRETLSENLSGSFGFSELLFNYLKENR